MKGWPETIETAIRETVAQFCGDTVPGSWLRCANAQGDDFNSEAEMTFPQIYIQATGKTRDNNDVTWQINFTADCSTDGLVDKTGRQRAEMYAQVERLFEAFLVEARDAEIWNYFSAAVRREFPTFELGGYTPLPGTAATFIGPFLTVGYSGRFFFTY